MSNARIDAAGSICATVKLSITGTLLPLASNELLDRPSILSFNLRIRFFILSIQHSVLMVREAGLTPELTGRAFNADRFKLTMKGKLNRAPVQ